jgi:hypothetical protein
MKIWLLFASVGVMLCRLCVSADTLELKTAVLVAEREVKPERIIPTVPRDSRNVKAGLLQLEESRVTLTQAGALRWEAKLPPGIAAQMLGAGDELACFQFWKITKVKKQDEYSVEKPGTVQRLRLSDGRWLDPLSVNAEVPEKPGAGEDVWAVCFDNTMLHVLTGKIKEQDMHERQLDYYRVTAFAAESGRQHWSKRFASAGDVPSAGVALLPYGGGRNGPRYASAGVNMLSTSGGKVFVCAGPSQPILALKVRDGEEAWKLENVWEFERGFIGPSVWQHYVSRFGDHDMHFFGDKEKALNAEQEKVRQALGKTCRVIGGPLVVDGGRETSIFVALAKSGSASFGGYLADCIVYEINESGKPVAIVKMPRMLIGEDYQIDARGVTWRCEHGALARLTPSHQTRHIGMGPGGSDCIARLEWYRELSSAGDDGGVGLRQNAWLKTGTAGDVSAFTEAALYSLPVGAWVENQNEHLIHFPLTRMDLKSGMSREFDLKVVSAGTISKPQSNYSSSGGTYSTHGAYFAAITGLAVHGAELWVTVGWEDGAAILVFDTTKL